MKFLKDYPKVVRDRFRKFHEKNPHVFDEFEKKSFEIINTGRPRYSAMRIIQAIRWDEDKKTTGDVFKINNDFTPIYSRMFTDKWPEFDGFFERRQVISKGKFSKEQKKREKNEVQKPTVSRKIHSQLSLTDLLS